MIRSNGNKEILNDGLPYDGTGIERKAGGIRKTTVPILLAGAAGIILLLWGNRLIPSCEGRTRQQATSADASGQTEEQRVEVLREELESRIETLCRQVRGAGDVTAAVSLDGGFRQIYATEEKGSLGGAARTYVTVGAGSSASPVFIGEEAPSVAGIGIVCTGGDDMNVRREITALLSAAFSVGANKIYVTGR